MSETYTVLSPWAKSNYLKKNPITLRLSSLSGKTIGLYASFKEYHPFFMRELERQLAARLPDTKFSHYTYIVDAKEIRDDSANYEDFKAWLSTVDAVIGVGADMGSCALYMGYNFAEIERLGTPAVLLSKYQYLSSASKGAGPNPIPVCGSSPMTAPALFQTALIVISGQSTHTETPLRVCWMTLSPH